MWSPKQPVNWSRVPANEQCLYCNEFFGEDRARTKEHMIGRSFVPSGSLAGTSFNFIFDACFGCNNDKSQLEGHVSAVTQLASQSIRESPKYGARAIAKARGEFHPWTGKPVFESNQKSTLRLNLMSVGLVAPPQPDRYMVRRLALRHIQALYALVTNPDRTQPLTLLYPGHVWVLGEYLRTDWGNPQLAVAEERTRGWAPRASGTTANGNFRFVLRRDSEQVGTWFWTLEWNGALRVAGGISYDSEPSFMRDLPDLGWLEFPLTNGNVYRTRRETPLARDGDDLVGAAMRA